MIPFDEITAARSCPKRLRELSRTDLIKFYTISLEAARDMLGFNATAELNDKILKAVGFLCSDKTPDITTDELLLAVKYGVQGKLGDTQGVNYRSIKVWIDKYLEFIQQNYKPYHLEQIKGIRKLLAAPPVTKEAVSERNLAMLKGALRIMDTENAPPKHWGWNKVYTYLVEDYGAELKVTDYLPQARAEMELGKMKSGIRFGAIQDDDVELVASVLATKKYFEDNFPILKQKFL